MTEPGAIQKNADAYRTISEVAADLKLPQHVLRFWETRFSQVRPLKRAGGRRFYRPEDVDLLRAVKALLYGDGYTIKGVQRLLREQGPRAVAALAASRGPAARPPVPRPAKSEVGAVSPAPIETASPEPKASAPTRVPDPAAADLGSPAGTTGEPADRLRALLTELGECARLLETARTPSRQGVDR